MADYKTAIVSAAIGVVVGGGITLVKDFLDRREQRKRDAADVAKKIYEDTKNKVKEGKEAGDTAWSNPHHALYGEG